jgi:FAD/FMN-containing dehydrogenase/Fe-S oxidoreductase
MPRLNGLPVRTTSADDHDRSYGALEADLRDAVDGEVRFDAGSRALYASDASNFRYPPIGVVIPRSIEAVVATHRICADHGAPIVSRGAGTSLSGETVNHAVVIDFSKYLHHVLDIDADERIARTQPGAINDILNEHAKVHGLVFGPDPSTHAYCTVGGNIGNNSCGIHSLHARFAGNGSRTSDNVRSLEVLTHDGTRMRVGPTSEAEVDRIIAEGGRRGQIYADLRALRDRYADVIRDRFVDIPRRVSGYNIDELLPERGFNVARALVGTEGTCVTVLEAELELVSNPAARSLLVVGYEDIFSVARHLEAILQFEPLACEAIDQRLHHNQVGMGIHADAISILPDGSAWVLVEVGGASKQESDAKAKEIEDALNALDAPPTGTHIFDDPEQESRLWEVREAGLGATAFPPDRSGDHWPGWEDSAVDPSVVEPYLRDLGALYDRYGFTGAMYGHLGDGCIHSRIDFDLRTPGGLHHYRRFMEDAADLVVSYGGSLSGEHGDGQQKGELLPRMYGDELMEAFRAFKRIWDPDNLMNPGKIVDARPLDADLRFGAEYNPPRPATKFHWVDDGGDFAHATVRCVGVGKCREPDGVDVMCPSFIATREEKHTTRGRARLLFEMLQGEIITDGWRSEEVNESLDLCLSCKGCTSDCPVHVDMPTYKAEFLHHHWRGRPRPRHAYALGYIDKWLALASKAPRVANAVTHAPGLGALVMRAAGATPQRRMPRLANTTLQDWFAGRPTPNPGGERVLLWPDTFNNRLHADTGRAAVRVLESLGYRVVMPEGHMCCGRPLYDYGLLGSAEKYLRRSLDVLRDEVRRGTPVVGMEPSCIATFKDELGKMLPHDDDGIRLRDNVFHFPEFLATRDVELPRMEGEALLWGHCHEKATGGMGNERGVLEAMGLDVEVVTGGCCGLAGSWGFEAGHHDLSLTIGEAGLLPAVRRASPRTHVVADGFSCQTQAEHGANRRPLHLAELIDRQLSSGS